MWRWQNDELLFRSTASWIATTALVALGDGRVPARLPAPERLALAFCLEVFGSPTASRSRAGYRAGVRVDGGPGWLLARAAGAGRGLVGDRGPGERPRPVGRADRDVPDRAVRLPALRLGCLAIWTRRHPSPRADVSPSPRSGRRCSRAPGWFCWSSRWRRRDPPGGARPGAGLRDVPAARAAARASSSASAARAARGRRPGWAPRPRRAVRGAEPQLARSGTGYSHDLRGRLRRRLRAGDRRPGLAFTQLVRPAGWRALALAWDRAGDARDIHARRERGRRRGALRLRLGTAVRGGAGRRGQPAQRIAAGMVAGTALVLVAMDGSHVADRDGTTSRLPALPGGASRAASSGSGSPTACRLDQGGSASALVVLGAAVVSALIAAPSRPTAPIARRAAPAVAQTASCSASSSCLAGVVQAGGP